MIDAGDREAVAWRAIQTATEMAKHARAVKLDTLAYLLEMVRLEAERYIASEKPLSDEPLSRDGT